MFDESQLLAALRDGNPIAFKQLFDTYSDKLYRLAIGLLQVENDAEDVVQESFLRLLENLEKFEGRSRLNTWLYRVTYNRCIDLLRQRHPESRFVDDYEIDENIPSPTILIDWKNRPEICVMSGEIETLLNATIADLPEKLRAIFILRELEGLSTQETANILEISVSAAKVRLHRARLLLREKLSSYFSERIGSEKVQ